jgi:hypothetical protein
MQIGPQHPEYGYVDCTLPKGVVRLWPLPISALLGPLRDTAGVLTHFFKCAVPMRRETITEPEYEELFQPWRDLLKSDSEKPEDDERDMPPEVLLERDTKRVQAVREGVLELASLGVSLSEVLHHQSAGCPYPGWTAVQFGHWVRAASRVRARARADSIDAVALGSSAVHGGTQGRQAVTDHLRKLRNG